MEEEGCFSRDLLTGRDELSISSSSDGVEELGEHWVLVILVISVCMQGHDSMTAQSVPTALVQNA